MPVITVGSLARPLIENLQACPFKGQVVGLFEQALNLVDGAGQVIAVTSPQVGNGPFSGVAAIPPGFFNREFTRGQSGWADRYGLSLGRWYFDWHAAKIWEPKLVSPIPRSLPAAGVQVLERYRPWPQPEGIHAVLQQRLVQAAAQLNQAVAGNPAEPEAIATAARLLAGLGQGLTPAGDDYLLGVMAALWLTGSRHLLPEIANAAAPQTTLLSAAFLSAAARGEFMEPWHELARSLYAGEVELLGRATAQIAQFGATSGREALAGFAATFLSLSSN